MAVVGPFSAFRLMVSVDHKRCGAKKREKKKRKRAKEGKIREEEGRKLQRHYTPCDEIGFSPKSEHVIPSFLTRYASFVSSFLGGGRRNDALRAA